MHSCTFGLNANVMRYVFALQILFINSEKLLCDSNVGLFDVHSIATFFGLIVWVTHANFHYVSQIFSFSCWLWTGLLNSLLSCRASHIFHSLALSHSSNSTLLTRICGALCYVQSEAGSFNSFESFFFSSRIFFPSACSIDYYMNPELANTIILSRSRTPFFSSSFYFGCLS